jgi:YfiR/HmsC-like
MPPVTTRTPSNSHRKRSFAKRRFVLVVALMCRLSGWSIEAQARPTEDDVKAAYLFNFGKFVRYPQDQLANSFDICLLGQDSIGPVLEAQVLDQRLQDRPVHIRHYDKASDARACAIVFIGGSEATRLDKDIAALEGSNALTVSDVPQFMEHGGMIQFVLHDNKVRFAVNLSPATRARLSLSSELLKVALYVNPMPSQEAP